MNPNARYTVYSLAGFYLIYLAYQMYGSIADASSEKPLMVIFMVLFVVLGMFLVIYSARQLWLNAKNRSTDAEQEEKEDDGQSGDVL